MRRHPLVVCALLAAGAFPMRGTAQVVLDRGSFRIYRNGEQVGVEAFRIERGTLSDGSSGFLITSTAAYPPSHPTQTLEVTLQIRTDSQVAVGRLEYGDGEREVVLASFGARRITLRVGRPGHESTREYPGSDRRVLAHDSLFAPFGLLPGAGPGPVQIVRPATDRRTMALFADRGRERTAVGAEERDLRHFVLSDDGESRHFWFDDQGHLVKATVPALGLTAVRAPEKRP